MRTKASKTAAETAPKTSEVETAVAEKAATDKTVEAKETSKTEVKEAEKKAPAKRAAKTATAKAAEKKETVKKTAAKKAEVKSNLTVQFEGKSYSQEELMKIAKDVWKYDLKKKMGDLKSVELYVKPEENTCYYVINDEIAGSFAL